MKLYIKKDLISAFVEGTRWANEHDKEAMGCAEFIETIKAYTPPSEQKADNQSLDVQNWNANIQILIDDAKAKMEYNLKEGLSDQAEYWRRQKDIYENDKADNQSKVVSPIEILKALVNLKDHKDKNGKDAYYEANQPVLWDLARQATTPPPTVTDTQVPKKPNCLKCGDLLFLDCDCLTTSTEVSSE